MNIDAQPINAPQYGVWAPVAPLCDNPARADRPAPMPAGVRVRLNELRALAQRSARTYVRTAPGLFRL